MGGTPVADSRGGAERLARLSVWLGRRVRSDGPTSFALAALLFAAALAGGMWFPWALLLALFTAIAGMAVLGVRSPAATAVEWRPSVHLRAAALTGHVLVVAVVGAFVIELAQGNIESTPWAQLLIVAAICYIGGLVWYSRHR